jgi:Arc/MetJ family transcription regulator
MTATMIDLDDEALEKAKLFYGTTTKKDTVNRALQDAAARFEERLGAFGRHLDEAFSEYQLLSDAEQADLRRRVNAVDDELRQHAARAGTARKQAGGRAAA